MITLIQLILLFFIALGSLGAVYVLKSTMNEHIKGMEAINKNLARIDKRLEEIEKKQS